jgi:uncharacterized protein YbaP (TraB family)
MLRACFLALFVLLCPFQYLIGQSVLWKITKTGFEKPSYIYGSMHSKNEAIFGFSDSLLRLIENVDWVVGELDLAQKPDIGFIQHVMLPENESLDKYLTKQQIKKVKSKMAAINPMFVLIVEKVQPIFTLTVLTTGDATEGTMPETLDEFFQHYARKKKIQTGGLETIEEQISALTKMPIEQQAKQLADAIAKFEETKTEADKALKQMLSLYLKGDIEQLVTVVGEQDGMSRELSDELLTSRNRRMADRMHNKIQQGNISLFAVVGCAHLGGPTGMIKLLQEKGYQVEPVLWPNNRTALPEIKAWYKTNK